MKVVVAIDSLKGSLSSLDAGNAIRRGILRADPEAEVMVKPMADGGEGTTEALVDAFGGEMRTVCVTGPYGGRVEAAYGLLKQRNMAVMEMASAAGITLSSRREPLYASTFGVGEMILDALEQGCRRFIIGIGGSATNDGGIGMLSALGWRFLDDQGADCPPVADSLGRVAQIDVHNVRPELAECRFQIACDVTNPLCGENGCTYVFGPQKGIATEKEKQFLDRAMGHYADVVAETFGTDHRTVPGVGAAGGLGFAFLSFLGGRLQPGIEIVLSAVELEQAVREADLVITGEGCLDGQTAFGKTPAGVAACAKKYGVPVVALAGSVKPEASICNQHGIDAFFPILPGIMTLEQAMQPETAKSNLSRTAEQLMRFAKCLSSV